MYNGIVVVHTNYHSFLVLLDLRFVINERDAIFPFYLSKNRRYRTIKK
nr:MAG TPA_asm: hypothetical protein [Caudoviricetes sp.]